MTKHISIWGELADVDHTLRHVDVGGVRTRVLQAGAGPDLVLLHGTGGHLEAYARDVAGLAEDFRVTCYDMVGHGWSDLPDRPFTVDVLSDHLLGTMDALGIGRAHLSGESLGGWVTAWTAAHHPGRVDRLVLNTPGNIANKPEVMARVRDSTRAAVQDPSEDTVRRRVEFLFHHTEMVTDELVALRSAVYTRPGFRRSVENILVLQDPEVRKDYAWDPSWVGKIEAATLLLWTEHDPTGGLDEAELLLEWVPDARLHVVADAGHWPQWEKVEEYLQVHRDFLLHRRGPVVTEIVGFVGMSHSPFATMTPPATPEAPGSRFMADSRRVARAVAALAPDAAVVIGADHFHAHFYDVMPPFVIGVEQVSGFGDFGTTPGAFPVATDLAWAVREGVTAAGFDVALSYALTVDHGLVQGYEMAGAAGVPMVPLVVNTAAPPLPGLDRCVALGRALGAVVRASVSTRRVLVIASGGLSHWLPSNDPRSIDGDRRRSVIHGRADVRAVAAVREPRVRAMGGRPDAQVNRVFDTWFLERLKEGDVDGVAAIGDEALERDAGSGGHEIRTWLVGSAAAGVPLAWTGYEAVPEWITGMGVGTTFPVR